VRSTSSGLSNILLLFLLFLLDRTLPFSLLLSSPLLFDYLPSAYLFSAQLWNISGIISFPFVVTLVSRSNSLWSPSSTAYNPQTDGQTEHVNQALEQYLRCYVDYNLSNWSDLLLSAEFAYNNQAHEGIKESPFYLEYGRHPRAGPILVKELLQRDLNDLTYKRHEALE